MAVSCVPADLAAAAKCFCIEDKTVQASVMIYLLAQIAGNTMTPAQLVDAAKCYCIPDSTSRDAVMIYLLCQAATAAGA